METINILHLSDLHICCYEDSNNAMIRRELSKDILETITQRDISIDMIVFTGDIIDRGNLASYSLAEEMLADIMKQIDVSVDHLVIVPGNHDVMRDKWDAAVVKQILEEKISLDNLTKPEWWRFIEVRFKDFSEFVKRVTKNDDEMLSYGIGIKNVNIYDTQIKFCLLNTAMLSLGGADDYQKLSVGRWQLECVRNQPKQIESDICIVVSHHPFEWLNFGQRELVEDYLHNRRKIGPNIIMHGHVHSARIKSDTSPDYSIIELVTGIGLDMSITID